MKRTQFKEILERIFLPEGIPNEEMKEKLLPLSKHIFEFIPSRLFRYRPCSEMNMDAFNEDKLNAITPDKFNDPYDSLIGCPLLSKHESKSVLYNSFSSADSTRGPKG